MIKPKQQMPSKKNVSYDLSSKSKQTTHFASTSNMIFSRRRRKRKVGVTLVSMLKKKQPPVSSLFSEAVTDASTKQTVNTVDVHEYSNEHKPYSDLRHLSFSNSESAGCCTPDVALHQNDTGDSCAQTTCSSCLSPIMIDDSSDTDQSSVADTTNVFSTSAVSEAGNREDVDYLAEDNGRVTHGLG